MTNTRPHATFFGAFALMMVFANACYSDDALSRIDQFGGPAAQVNSRGIAMDSEKNIITVWSLAGTADFNPRNGTALRASDNGQVVVSKIDKAGKLKWAVQLGTPQFQTGSVTPYAMSTDASDNIFIVGQFSGTADFDPGANANLLTNAGDSSGGFIVKLNSAGQFVWAGHFASTSDAAITGITTGFDDKIVVCGRYYDSMDFNPTAALTTTLTSAGSGDAFVIQLLTDGNLGFSANIRDDASETCEGVVQDAQGNIYYTGTFTGFSQTGNVDFDPSGGSFVMGGTGFSSVYIVKVTKDRGFLWAKQFNSNGNSLGNPRIAVDKNGDVFVSGTFYETCDFDPGAGVFNLAPTSNSAAYLVKLSMAGEFIWVKAVSGNDLIPASLTTDKKGAVYLSCLFVALAKTGLATAFADSSKIPSYYQVYFEKRKPNGKRVWSGTIGDDRSITLSDGLVVDRKLKLYSAASFNKTIDIEPGESEVNRTAEGGRDGLLLKFNLPKD